MAAITKKIWPEYFEAIQSGDKRLELRLNDVTIRKGDTLQLREWDPNTKAYTGRVLEKRAADVLQFTINGLEKHWPKQEILEKGLQVISIE